MDVLRSPQQMQHLSVSDVGRFPHPCIKRFLGYCKKDAFPLPRIEDSLTSLTQAEWYSTLDLASGYWQVQVNKKDEEKTAFTTPMGLFEWEHMPFGLCNGPFKGFQDPFGTSRCSVSRFGAVWAKIANQEVPVILQTGEVSGKLCQWRGSIAPVPDKLTVVREWPTHKTVKQTFHKPVPQIAVGQLNMAMVKAPGGHPSDTPSGWGWDPKQWRDLQGQDAVLRRVLRYVEVGSLPLRVE
ncbi:Transposon Ty3-I Gag-Pol polyprotein [Labeo rohita]|uniref:ribonuclease H n=1 Tax=Labeo rohita TaxID=84645 RepID=A0ABQ8M162_LABRO|nr:Transposon Ty3-I Gag-Pol polyprotein [Labeo rohita]